MNVFLSDSNLVKCLLKHHDSFIIKNKLKSPTDAGSCASCASAPSCRSDLQSLGYCMLRWHTGTLPWSELAQPDQVAAQKQRYNQEIMTTVRIENMKRRICKNYVSCRYMEDVKALMSHCFRRQKVSSEFQCFVFLDEVSKNDYII